MLSVERTPTAPRENGTPPVFPGLIENFLLLHSSGIGTGIHEKGPA